MVKESWFVFMVLVATASRGHPAWPTPIVASVLKRPSIDGHEKIDNDPIATIKNNLNHSTLGLRAIKKKKNDNLNCK